MGRKALSNQLIRNLVKSYRKDYGNTCFYCGCDLAEFGSQKEHIIPVSKGGTDDESNLVLVCPFCNRAKWDFDLVYLLKWFAHIRSKEFKCEAKSLLKGENSIGPVEFDRLNHILF